MEQKYHVVAINKRTGGRYVMTDIPANYITAREVAEKFGKSVIFDIAIEVADCGAAYALTGNL